MADEVGKRLLEQEDVTDGRRLLRKSEVIDSFAPLSSKGDSPLQSLGKYYERDLTAIIETYSEGFVSGF